MRRIQLPLRRSHAIAVVALSVGLAGGVVIGPMLTADASVTPISAGQYCTPRGGVYRTATVTMLCAQSISAARVVDAAWRWRDITTPACPVGYVRQILHIQALPRGETKVRSVQVVECALTTVLPSPSPTPVASATTSPSPVDASPTPSPQGPGGGG